jgi:flagellar motor switch protein FliN/FliY
MADESDIIGQQEIENLLQQAQGAQEPPPAEPEPKPDPTMPPSSVDVLPKPELSDPAVGAPDAAASDGGEGRGGDDVQFLLDQAEEALSSVDQPSESGRHLQPFQLSDFTGSAPSEEKATLDLMRDVELDVQIELGRTHMYLDEVLRLRRGCVVALDKLAGDPVDIFVNGRLIARGEVLVLNDNFCVRVAKLISGDDTG